MGKTADYYKSHPAARRKKQAYDIRHNKSKAATDKRVELNRFNRKATREGRNKKGDKKDASHQGNKIVGYVRQSSNRGDTNNSKGDRSARGKARPGMKFRRRSR